MIPQPTALTAIILLTLGLAGIAQSAAPAPAKAAAPSKTATRLTPEQQSTLDKLLAEYRQAGTELEKKEQLVEKALELGSAAAPAVLTAIERDLQPGLRRYTARVQQQAGALAKRHFPTVDRKEVERLRGTVLALQTLGDSFTHDTIVEKGDPALRRLQEVLVVGRAKVLNQSEELREERRKLKGLGRLWEKCQKALHEQSSDPEGKPSAPPSFDQFLQGEEQTAAILAMPMDTQTRAILAENAKLSTQLDPEEARCILALNVTRSLLGLNVLAIDLKLCLAARDHSQDMETKGFFAHESPLPGKKTPADRAQRMGTTCSAENIASGPREGKAANMMWFHSPGHHKNMLGNHNRVGIGRSGRFFTEMFGR